MSKSSDDASTSLIKSLLKKGDRLLDKEDFKQAKVVYQQALNVLNDCDEVHRDLCKETLIALGDVCFLSSDYKQAVQYLDLYLEHNNGKSNPMLNLRLGQSLFEIGDVKGGWEYLFKAFMSGGVELFSGEDTKYLFFVQENNQVES